jgi:acyl carrier protein
MIVLRNKFFSGLSNDLIRDRVFDIIENTFGIDKGDIKLDLSFRKDLGADDLALIDFTMDLEGEFNIYFSSQESKNLRTVGDVIKVIDNKLKSKKD